MAKVRDACPSHWGCVGFATLPLALPDANSFPRPIPSLRGTSVAVRSWMPALTGCLLPTLTKRDPDVSIQRVRMASDRFLPVSNHQKRKAHGTRHRRPRGPETNATKPPIHRRFRFYGFSSGIQTRPILTPNRRRQDQIHSQSNKDGTLPCFMQRSRELQAHSTEIRSLRRMVGFHPRGRAEGWSASCQHK